MSTFADYRDDPSVRLRSWQARLDHPAWTAEPNAAHRALVSLERSDRLVALVTQNIDGLHQRAGNRSVLELHGTMHETVCLTCNDRRPMREALDRVAAGTPDPSCPVCGGILKSATISFGQPLDTEVLMAARDAVLSCDLMLAVGSSLSVQPAAGLVGLAAQAGATVVICNASETPYDDLAAIVLRGPLGEVLPALLS
jgi:NAD-dependent deacetylase